MHCEYVHNANLNVVYGLLVLQCGKQAPLEKAVSV